MIFQGGGGGGSGPPVPTGSEDRAQKRKLITYRNPILDISKCQCELENYVKVTKIQPTLTLLPAMYLCKFGQDTSSGSEDNARKPYFGHYNVPVRPRKLGQGH